MVSKKTYSFLFFKRQRSTSFIAYLRTKAPYLENLPLNSSNLKKTNQNNDDFKKLNLTLELITKAETAFKNKQWRQSEDYFLDAYLEGFEGLEKKLKIENFTLVKNIESQFIRLRSTARNKDPKFYSHLKGIREQLKEVRKIILRGKNKADSKGEVKKIQ